MKRLLVVFLLAAIASGQISHNPTNNIEGDPAAGTPSVPALVGKKSTDGTLSFLKIDATGGLVTTALTGFGADFAFGDITSASTTKKHVERTTYTEQTTNAQRSIASANANDTSAGTGARTIRITYLNSTGSGPYTETVTLNGTAYVNTTATNICFIEQMEVITAGSGGANAGILTLKAATAGGGATIGTINAGDKQTFWAHHYIPTGKIANITGVTVSHNGTTVGSGAVFYVNVHPIGVSDAIEYQVTDFVRLYGQSSTFARTYTSPVKVTGPASLVLHVVPESASSFVYRGAIDFFEP